MAPKKEVKKMDLSSFLADDTFGSANGSWADDFDPTMIQNPSSSIDIGFQLPSNEPVFPDEPPFTARIASFPDGTTEDELRNFFVNGLKLDNPGAVIEDFYCPKDREGNLKPFAFITFISRELLVDAIALNDQPIHNKPVYVSVAKPSKKERGPARNSRYNQGESDMDWNGARGARTQREPRREHVQIDWDSARSSRTVPVRDGEERQFRGPPRERRAAPREDSFDWGAARGSQTQPEIQERERSFRGPKREPREPREPREDSFDWGAARGSQVQPEPQEREKTFRTPKREPKEPKEDTFDWGAARGSLLQKEQPRKTFKPKAKEDTFEWGTRGSMLKKEQTKLQTQTPTKTEKKESTVDGPKKSMFSVLQTEDDEDEDEEQEESKASTTTEKTETSANLVKATTDLSLEDDGWTVQKN